MGTIRTLEKLETKGDSMISKTATAKPLASRSGPYASSPGLPVEHGSLQTVNN